MNTSTTTQNATTRQILFATVKVNSPEAGFLEFIHCLRMIGHLIGMREIRLDHVQESDRLVITVYLSHGVTLFWHDPAKQTIEIEIFASRAFQLAPIFAVFRAFDYELMNAGLMQLDPENVWHWRPNPQDEL